MNFFSRSTLSSSIRPLIHSRRTFASNASNAEGGANKKALIAAAASIGLFALYQFYKEPAPSKYDDPYVKLSGMEESAKTQFFNYRDESYLKPELQKGQGKYIGALSDPSTLPDAPRTKGK